MNRKAYFVIFWKEWLGREGSNLRMSVPKTDALPLGDAPTIMQRDRLSQSEWKRKLPKLPLERKSRICRLYGVVKSMIFDAFRGRPTSYLACRVRCILHKNISNFPNFLILDLYCIIFYKIQLKNRQKHQLFSIKSKA